MVAATRLEDVARRSCEVVVRVKAVVDAVVAGVVGPPRLDALLLNAEYIPHARRDMRAKPTRAPIVDLDSSVMVMSKLVMWLPQPRPRKEAE